MNKDEARHCECEQCSKHLEKVDLVVGVLSGLMAALAVNPMFAGFLPPDLRDKIKAIG